MEQVTCYGRLPDKEATLIQAPRSKPTFVQYVRPFEDMNI